MATRRRQELELAALAEFNESHLITATRRSSAGGTDQVVRDGVRHADWRCRPLSTCRRKSDATLNLYGLPRGSTQGFGWQCLVARRLVERGVRFVELIDTGSSGGNWDSHGDMADHGRLAKNVDQAIAGLLMDLKQRGLFDDVLVVWTTEFGRTPFNNTADNKGREHHSWAFSSWLAGAGVRRGFVHGATDEHGIRPVESPVHVHDFHATILHLMGLDHTRLTYRHAGRDYRLTDVHGNVVSEILS